MNIYPLYYLDDIIGININFKLNNLFIERYKWWKKEDYIYTLFASCAFQDKKFKMGDYLILQAMMNLYYYLKILIY